MKATRHAVRFTEDYLFDTPSGAAQVILGRNANGWMVWETGDGKTLHEVERVHPEAVVVAADGA